MADLTEGTVEAALKSVRDLRSNGAEVDPAVRIRREVPDPVDTAYGIMQEEMAEGQRRAFKRILAINDQSDLKDRIQAILNDK